MALLRTHTAVLRDGFRGAAQSLLQAKLSFAFLGTLLSFYLDARINIAIIIAVVTYRLLLVGCVLKIDRNIVRGENTKLKMLHLNSSLPFLTYFTNSSL